jgi:hypothetical protein
MKKQPLFIFFLMAILTLFATACASNTAAGTSSATDSGSANTQESRINSDSTTTQENSSDPIFQLAIGTMLLEDSELAILPEQAAQLLPLWQVYQNLINSDTAAQVEIDAIEKQIEDSMLPEQIEAINGMEISDKSLSELFENMGLEFGLGGRMGAQGTPGAGMSGTPFPGFEPGEMPEGAMPGGGQRNSGGGERFGGGMGGGMAPEGMPDMQGQMDPSLQTTREAQMASRQNSGLNPMLLNALIEFLEGKIQANS